MGGIVFQATILIHIKTQLPERLCVIHISDSRIGIAGIRTVCDLSGVEINTASDVSMNTGQVQHQFAVNKYPYIIVAGEIKDHPLISLWTGHSSLRLHEIHLHIHAEIEVRRFIVIERIQLAVITVRCSGITCFLQGFLIGPVRAAASGVHQTDPGVQGIGKRFVFIVLTVCFLRRSIGYPNQIIPINRIRLRGLFDNIIKRQEVSKRIPDEIRRQDLIVQGKLVIAVLRMIDSAVKPVFACVFIVLEQTVDAFAVDRIAEQIAQIRSVCGLGITIDQLPIHCADKCFVGLVIRRID